MCEMRRKDTMVGSVEAGPFWFESDIVGPRFAPDSEKLYDARAITRRSRRCPDQSLAIRQQH